MKKNEFGRYVIADRKQQRVFNRCWTHKEGISFIDEYDFNTLKKTRLYTSNMKDKKEDLMSIEDFKKEKC